MTTVYDYIAKNNPQGSKNLCEEFGYQVTNPRTMSENLKMLVNAEGENALESMMDLHPDKEIILEYFSKPNTKEDKNSNCVCGNNNNISNTPHLLEHFLNASGRNDNNEAKALATNTNTIIFASCLVLAVAIIFKNDK
tara:strand:- start:155 stop:568 length:414 start_codon:yes stop_codon:yes gene_type:complete